MKRRLTFLIAGAYAIFVVGYGVRGKAQQSTSPASPPPAASQPAAPQPAAEPASPAATQQAVVRKYCYTCHNDKLKSGGLALTALDISAPAKNIESWEKVIRKLGTGAMPPAKMPRPDKATADSLVRYLETELDRAALANPNPGRPGLQRLNRTEYQNAIRDLLALDIDVASILPADTAGYGFDNNADALTLSPALTERYLNAAAKISQVALERPRGVPTPETFFEPTDRSEAGRFSDDMPFGTRGGLAIHYVFPADGDYLIETHPKENGANDGFENFSTEIHQFDIAIDSVNILSAGLGGPEWSGRNRLGPKRVENEQKMLEKMKVVVHVKGGEHLIQAYFASKTATVAEDLFDPSVRREPYRPVGGVPKLSYLRITGPLQGTASISTDTESRRRVLICSPSSATDEACAKRIISTLARRAYRHPVTDSEMEVLLLRYRAGAKDGGFESGIEMALRKVLLSPKFLFRLESQPPTVAANTPYRLSDIDLASRLSFFLWSSIPDDTLLDLAAKGTLHQPDVMHQQVKRMLADPKSQALVDNFAGQWLQVRNVQTHQPSPETLFHFDDNLRKALEEEMRLFFASIIRENRPITDLLDADYTFLNERLAKHYGIPGIIGQDFRRVTLPADSVRGGLLGKGAILMSTSYPNRTSVVIRGKWILENVFGTPPPPPPPNVPALAEEKDPRKVLPMREQMAAHRANPVCAGCHSQMDQLGFALENFDAIGEWRDSYSSGTRVDASGQLPDGSKFDGPVELRKVLREHSDQFVTTAAEKLLTYALGRGLEACDTPALRAIKRGSVGDNYRFESLIQQIVVSVPFTERMSVDMSSNSVN
jgi:mono/diheme cytochrome c family protein